MLSQSVAFQSFPRCGNTFLRRFIEQITGVYTGTDMVVSHTFADAMMGLLGQEHLPEENRIWITKTHFPYSMEMEPSFRA